MDRRGAGDAVGDRGPAERRRSGDSGEVLGPVGRRTAGRGVVRRRGPAGAGGVVEGAPRTGGAVCRSWGKSGAGGTGVPRRAWWEVREGLPPATTKSEFRSLHALITSRTARYNTFRPTTGASTGGTPMRKAGITALAIAATAAALGGAPAASAAEATGTITGVVWHDLNANGLRDAGEPGVKNAYVGIKGLDSSYVATAADGSYSITAPAGSHVVHLADNSGFGRVWGPQAQGGSAFGLCTGETAPISVAAGEAARVDGGLVSAVFDFQPTEFTLSPAKDVYAVGDVVEVLGGITHDGAGCSGAHATLDLPAGVTKLDRLGDYLPFYATDKPNQVTGQVNERRAAGHAYTLGARVVVDRPLDAAEFRISTMWNDSQDPDHTNNSATTTITAN